MLDGSPSPPFSFGVSGQTDANGNASLNVIGFQPGIPAAFNLSLDVQGNAPLVTILQGVFQLAAANAVNGNAIIGSVITDGSSPLSITVTGALPNTAISGLLTGIQSDDPTELAGVSGQTSLTVGTVTAYDGFTLIADNNVTYTGDTGFPGPLTTSVWDVRLWASVLLGLRLSAGNPIQVTFRWYANPDGTRLVGQRALILDTGTETAIATIPNLGPYLNVVVQRLAGGQFTWNASLLTSQRIVTDVFGGNFTPYLLEVEAQTDPPNQTDTFEMGTLYGGPVLFTARNRPGSPGNVTVNINHMSALDGSFKGLGLLLTETLSPGTVFQNVLVLPAAPVQVKFTSGSAAGNYIYDAICYSTTTGSS